MRWHPKRRRIGRLQPRSTMLTCLAFAGLAPLGALCACGCQGPQLDRLDGSPSGLAGAQLPILENERASAQSSAQSNPHDTQAPRANAVTQTSDNAAAITENLNRGHREAALNHPDEAEVCYRHVLELDPEHPVANHRLAILEDRRGDFTASEKRYRKAINRDANNADLWSDLGYSYLLQGRHAESERCLQAAIRVNPLHQKALDNLSLLYVKLGDRDRAFEVLKHSVGEVQARARIAQLFPSERASAPDEETITASFEPPQSQGPVNHASTPITIADADGRAATGQSSLERQLADLMGRERQRAIEQRSQRQPGSTPPASQVDAVLNEPRPGSQPTAPWSNTTAHSASPTGQPAIATGRVPDERINDAFAAIDRESSEQSAAAAAPVESPAGAPARPSSAWDQGTTVLKPEPPDPPQSIPHWPVPPTTPSLSVSPAPLPQRPVSAPSPTAKANAEHPDPWNPVSTASSVDRNADPQSNVPAALFNPPMLAENLPEVAPSPVAPSPTATGSHVAESPAAQSPISQSPVASKDEWDQEVPPIAEWSGGSSDKLADRAPSGPVSRLDGALDAAPPQPPPRIVPLRIVPTSAPMERVPDWDMQDASGKSATAKKPYADFDPRRVAADVPTQPKPPHPKLLSAPQFPKPQLPKIGGFSDDLPSSEVSDPRSMRIEPRCNPLPGSLPNDFAPVSKQPATDKQASFGSDADWSDLPQWQPPPPSGSSSGDRGNGPTIRPGP